MTGTRMFSRKHWRNCIGRLPSPAVVGEEPGKSCRGVIRRSKLPGKGVEVESAGESRGTEPPEITEHGLKSDAIGFRDALIIGIASTAPAYSLAAVIGLVVTVGVQAPAVLLTSFIPMFFVATAFYYMKRADQHCGTTFSRVTRTMGPWAGWIGGS